MLRSKPDSFSLMRLHTLLMIDKIETGQWFGVKPLRLILALTRLTQLSDHMNTKSQKFNWNII